MVLSSDLTGKLEADVEIKASPKQFHDMLTNKLQHIHHTLTDKIVQGCNIHEGEVGNVGAILSWNYVHDGKAKMVKKVVEAIDSTKNLITFRVIDGDLLTEYKSFVSTIQVSPKSEGNGSIVHLTFEYEKLHDGIEQPKALVQLLKDVYKNMDAYLTQAN